MNNNSFVKKEEKKNNILNAIIIGVIVLIVGAFLIIVSNKSVNRIIKLTYTDYQEKIKEDTDIVVYYGRVGCSHCQQYKPIVSLVADEYDLVVYYVDIDTLSEEEYIDLHDSLSVTKDYYDGDDPIVPTPITAIFKSGVEKDSELGNIKYDGLVNLLDENNVIKKK